MLKALHPAGNPFSTRYVRPGAIEYRFSAGNSAESIVARLAANGWRGAIVGPHGSGKSTLLQSLLPAIESAGRQPYLITLHDGQRRLPIDLARNAELTADAVVIVDGYEQLSRWSRWQLARLCRRRRWGLVVTSHAVVDLPTIYTSETTLEQAYELAEQLLVHGEPLIHRNDIESSFVARNGNLRELLFDLYDLYEARRAGLGR